MSDQPEFDRLRQTCSARLEQFITEARQTEFSMKQLTLPVSQEAGRQFSSHRNAEVIAFENYMLASMRLGDFVQQHLYIVN
jgi:hypothetical protein